MKQEEHTSEAETEEVQHFYFYHNMQFTFHRGLLFKLALVGIYAFLLLIYLEVRREGEDVL